MDSFELLRRLIAARPDDPLWAVLLRRCQALIRRTMTLHLRGRPGGGTALLDDLGQEVMERLLAHDRRGLVRFAGQRDETFDGYIRRIAENILFDRLRRDTIRLEQERLVPPEELWRLEGPAREAAAGEDRDDPQLVVEKRELREVVEQTLREISPDDRQRALNRLLFRLYFLDGCSIPQIARMRAVTLSSSTVGRRITLMRAALRRSLLRQLRGPGRRNTPRVPKVARRGDGR